MTDVLGPLRDAVVLAFVLLGLATGLDWLRRRDPARAYLALSIGLLAVVALLSTQPLVRGNASWAATAAVLAFLGSGYALLLFRSSVVPLARRWHVLALAAILVSSLLFVLAGVPAPRTGPTPLQSAAVLIMVAVLGTVLPLLALAGLLALVVGVLLLLPYATWVSAHLFGRYCRMTDGAVAGVRRGGAVARGVG